MNKIFWTRQLPLCLMIAALLVTAVAWQSNPGENPVALNDTTPDKKIRNIDDALSELDKAEAELERTIQKKDWEKDISESLRDFDAEKIRAEMEKALKEVDAAKIQAEVQKAMAAVNFEKMQKELADAMKEANSEDVRRELEKAMKQVDAARIQAEIQASIAKVDVEKIMAELARVNEMDFEKMEKQLKEMGPRIEESLKGATESIEKARKELLEYKTFLNGLQKDGLISENDDYTVSYENGKLTINGKEQPAEVAERYRGFLKDRKDFTIRKNKDGFNIHHP